MKKRHLASFLCVQIMPVRDVYCQTLQKRSSCHFLARAQKRVDLISRFMMGNSVKHNNNKGSEKSRNCFLNTIFRRVNLGLSRCTMSLPSRHLFFVGFKKKGSPEIRYSMTSHLNGHHGHNFWQNPQNIWAHQIENCLEFILGFEIFGKGHSEPELLTIKT